MNEKYREDDVLLEAQPLKPQTFNVSDQVDNLAQLIRPLAGSRIRVETDIVGTECFAVANQRLTPCPVGSSCFVRPD